MTDDSAWDALPDVAYYYTTREKAVDPYSNGLPPDAVLNTRALTPEQARELYGLPKDAEVACLAVDLQLLRKCGFPPPQVRTEPSSA